MSKCEVAECERARFSKRWCSMHYKRWKRTGDPTLVYDSRPRGAASDRFWAKVDKSGDCWLWTASLDFAGYGQFWNGRKIVKAHRFAWTEIKGALTDGLELDHACHSADANCAGGRDCRHRACVNPDHLEEVSKEENIRRGRSRAATIRRFQNQTHCKRGHEFDEENTYLWRGIRNCRECARNRRRSRSAA